jgi:uncharacterized protein (DUF305 family)
MDNRVTLLSGFIGSGLAGIALAAYITRAGPSDQIRQHIDADPARSRNGSICGDGSNVSEATFYSQMRDAYTRMHDNMVMAPSGNTDRDFARMMIAHHQGAIDMALVQLKYGRDERLRRLAQSIIVEQGQEIAYMRSLLDATTAPSGSARIADE